jgi:hypothetical protein
MISQDDFAICILVTTQESSDGQIHFNTKMFTFFYFAGKKTILDAGARCIPWQVFLGGVLGTMCMFSAYQIITPTDGSSEGSETLRITHYHLMISSLSTILGMVVSMTE